jgi:hypothetical protein
MCTDVYDVHFADSGSSKEIRAHCGQEILKPFAIPFCSHAFFFFDHFPSLSSMGILVATRKAFFLLHGLLSVLDEATQESQQIPAYKNNRVRYIHISSSAPESILETQLS